MGDCPDNTSVVTSDAVGAIVLSEANFGRPSTAEAEQMARRRFQDPKPEKVGDWWYIRVWQDQFTEKGHVRVRKRIKLAPAHKGMREVQKLAADVLRPLNQGLVSVGAGVNFSHYVEYEYNPKYLPDRASPVQDCYLSMLKNHITPAFHSKCLADLTRSFLKGYFVTKYKQVEYPTLLKIRDALSHVLRSAVDGEFLLRNPLDGLALPKDKRGKRQKPVITYEQFCNLVNLMPEPYASMVFVCTWAGLRVSEVIGLRWRDVSSDSITIAQRYCRGDLDQPKTEDSGKPIAIEPEVIQRLEQLKNTTVSVRAGRAIRTYKAVKSCGPDDLVFQSVRKGGYMRDGNVLRRFIKPAARKLGIGFVNWLVLRRSYATWLIESGVDVKSAQGQMRHSRPTTTLGIYAQIVPTAQRRAARHLSGYVKQQTTAHIVPMVQ